MPDDRAVRGLTSDFSPVAARYDATRHIPADRLLAGYDRLIAAGLLPARGRVCDAGCGTGQVSLPLADRGYAVVGYDVSAEMVRIARAKCPPGADARFAVADIRALPDPPGSFDAAVVSKLFMHVADWQATCRELIRVTRPGGSIVHVRDRGAFGNAVRRHFAGGIRAMGHTELFPGLDPGSNGDLVAFLAAEGCRLVPVASGDLRWRVEVAAGDTLRALRERLFAEFWYVPDPDYAAALARTEAWVADGPGGPARTEILTPYLALDVFVVGG